MSDLEKQEETRPPVATEEETLEAASAEGETAETGAEPAAEATGTEAPAGEDLAQKLAEAEARAAVYYQQMVRLQADFANFRRRTLREKEELIRTANEGLVRELLPVLDNFERALHAAGENLADFRAGVQMIYRQLYGILEQQGLAPVPAVGEAFDPARHEAMEQVVSDEYPDNTVIEELRRGYYFQGKLLRAALVKVARSAEQEATGQEE